MATRNRTRPERARGDELVVDDSGTWTRYEGTRQVLIERAGIPAAAWDDANRRSANIWKMQDGDRSIEVRKKSLLRFLVYVGYGVAEQARRAAERETWRKAEQERAAAAAAIARWPSDASAWRTGLLRMAGALLSMVERDAAGEQNPGFRLDADAMDELGVHLQLIRGLLETASVVPDPEARARREAQLRARVVAADPGLARFLAATGAIGGGA